MTKSAEATSLPPVEPNQDSSDSTELPDVPWACTSKLKGTNHNYQRNTDPEPPLTLRSNPLTAGTVPQPMRPGSDPGTPPEAAPE